MNKYQIYELVEKILGYLLIIILAAAFTLLILFIWNLFPIWGLKFLYTLITLIIPTWFGWMTLGERW